MEGNNVKYLTPEEARNIDPSQIESMTMHSGSIIYVTDGARMQENEFIEEEIGNQNQSQKKHSQTCKLCGKNYISSKLGNKPSENIVLRAKKETKVKEEENGEEKVEETVEIEVEAQPKEGNEKKEVLRGPDGKPLLMDIITGKEIVEEQPPEVPSQDKENIPQEYNYPTQQEQNAQQYYEEQQGMNQTSQQQYALEQNEEINDNPCQDQNYNQEQYYPNENQESNTYPQEQDQKIYPPQEVQEQTEPNYQNQNQNYYDQTQGQEQANMYPTFEETDNNQYQQAEFQPTMDVPQQNPEYYPETQPQMEQNIQPEYYPETQPQMDQNIQPEYYPETQPQMQQPIEPPNEMPIHPPNQPPIQPQQQINPQIQPSVQPPIQPEFRPPMPNKKKPVVQIKFGFGLPKIKLPGMIPKRRGFPQHQKIPQVPYGPQVPYMPGGHPGQFNRGMGFVAPRQPQRFVPGGKRIVVNPIGNIVNAVVHEVMAPIASIAKKGIRLRSEKPTGTTQKEIPKQKELKNDVVLRARRKEANNYSDNQQQGPILCDECAAEEYNNAYAYYQSDYNNFITGNNANYESQSCQNKQEVNIDNFNYHEIVETSDNSKSHIVVTKGGVVISSDK